MHFFLLRVFLVIKYTVAALIGIVLYALCALYVPGAFNALQRAARTLYETLMDAIFPENWVAVTAQIHLEDKIVFAVFIILALLIMKGLWWSTRRPFRRRKR